MIILDRFFKKKLIYRKDLSTIRENLLFIREDKEKINQHKKPMRLEINNLFFL